MWWILGGGIGLVIGFIVVCFIATVSLKVFQKKDQQEKCKKIIGSLSNIIIVIFGILGLFTFGYCGRTELIEGDFSAKVCDIEFCDEPSICRFFYNFNGGDYYCEKHISFCHQVINNDKSTSSDDNIEDSYGHDKFDVMVIAEDAVESKLKSPSTAEFCSTSEASISEYDNTWRIRGYVDAQNSFGAMVRSNFRLP